jgi:hypothetical protein
MNDRIIGNQNKWLSEESFLIGKDFPRCFIEKIDLFRITDSILACSRPTVRHSELKKLFFE